MSGYGGLRGQRASWALMIRAEMAAAGHRSAAVEPEAVACGRYPGPMIVRTAVNAKRPMAWTAAMAAMYSALALRY